jgi:hypothetical protein
MRSPKQFRAKSVSCLAGIKSECSVRGVRCCWYWCGNRRMATLGIVFVAEFAGDEISIGHVCGKFDWWIFSGRGCRLFCEAPRSFTSLALVRGDGFSRRIDNFFDLLRRGRDAAGEWRYHARTRGRSSASGRIIYANRAGVMDLSRNRKLIINTSIDGHLQA